MKKSVLSAADQGKQNGTIMPPGKEKEKTAAVTPTSYGRTISIDSGDSDGEVLLAATREFELLRSWVDAGIDIATREMAGEDW